VAASGTLIVTQDYRNQPVYIRHQLTTETGKGSLYYEDNLGVNLDDVSFRMRVLLRGYIGKRNITPDTLREIWQSASNMLTDLAQTTIESRQIGVQILDYENLIVAVDPVLRDRILLDVDIEFPSPINSIVASLRATAGIADLTI